MTSSLNQQVEAILLATPGLKAKDLAKQLGVDKNQVNSALFGPLRAKFYQDNLYRWWPQGAATGRKRATKPQALDTQLARLARYYLDCITRDDQGGVKGVFASSHYDLDYVELPTIPSQSDSPFDNENARRLLGRLRQDRGRMTLTLGYPVRLKKIRAKSGWEGFVVEPVLYFTLEEDPTNRQSPPMISDTVPQINSVAIRSLTGVEGVGIVDEVVQLSADLGLSNPQTELPELDELVTRLRAIRPEWDWQEDPDPSALTPGPPLAESQKQGIYNRAILIATERSPYTRGLEAELAALQNVPEKQYAGTALGTWISGRIEATKPPPQEPLLEILPLNSEQRQAVLQGLNNPITIITGPPGTGKSQVVTSLLVNSAWRGKTALFASKNNKAVDVVETRVNALGPRPVLLRLGAGEFEAKVAEYMISLLAASGTDEDERRHEEAHHHHQQIRSKFRVLEQELDQTVKLRNQVDVLEQRAERARQFLGKEIFANCRSLDLKQLAHSSGNLKVATARADRAKQTLLIRLFWPLFRSKRFQALQANALRAAAGATHLGVTVPTSLPTDGGFDAWRIADAALQNRIPAAQDACEYFSALARLQSLRGPEAISAAMHGLVDELTNSSQSLWESWLQLQPKRLTTEQRRLLHNQSTLLRMVIGNRNSDERLSSEVLRKYHAIFPQIINLLGCWAVTSLSAKGRIPLEPGFFDLLVIDEASQCDIASALPLLYRAKRAVIIGDPKQLRHISSLPPRCDEQMLVKHALLDSHGGWAYGTNSLFDLASGQCRGEDVVLLRDHHRSHADIIEFSNQHFYEGRLRVATRHDRLRHITPASPAVRWIDVTGHVDRPATGSAINEREAVAVIQELERLVLQQKYTGSIGVVSPFRAQANRIRELVAQNKMLSNAVANNDFLADAVHSFQGDERDIILFSPVMAHGIANGALSFLKGNPNLFNVAITRARASLVVIGDRGAALSGGVEYLQRFAEYVGTVRQGSANGEPAQAIHGPDYPAVARPETVSDWEKMLYRALYARGLRTLPQFSIEKYCLDLALISGDRRLDIEVDGERYHRNWDGELCRRDLIRNQRLNELGWDVIRFWVYEVRDDLQRCVARVQAWYDNQEVEEFSRE